MKELTVGDISVYSEDDDSWDELIKVIKKANKAYLQSLREIETSPRESWLKSLIRNKGRSIISRVI
jgi:hypothetical protein